MQSYRNRSSVCSVDSAGSGSSTSTSASSSLTNPTPLTIACPDILEDADGEDERPPAISISDEQVDEHPFDPSLPDELYVRMAQQAAACAPPGASPTAGSLHERVSRLFALHRAGAPPPATLPGSPTDTPQRAGSWLAKLRPRRESHADADAPPSPTGPAREPGTVLACTKRPRRSLRLVPLDQAQQREDIIRHPEGFELAERRNGAGASP
ncbi:hypothetical protein PsYK624_084860 [Phanerochaete sordida]|uniref:Uncharacterized protein n=1 Tax=Phanerochaete sordida TaxID=48140 RepID=A0A9P3GAR2_9APHY|nr:hypothetical protein PsYK624_084860 [Phanerochaete sordida]